MKRIFVITFLGIIARFLVGYGSCKELDFHFIKIEKMNQSDELFKYDIHSVDKINQTTFKTNADVELYVDVDSEWHFWIQAYRNEDMSENFDEKPLVSLPKKEFCEFLNTTYRQYMWNSLENTSNFPSPGTCPVKAGKYYLKDYIYNAEKYKSFAKDGGYRIDLFVSQDHEESHVTKMGVRIFFKVEERE